MPNERAATALVLLGRASPSFFIFEMRLVLGNPNRAAAPSGPPIIQPVSSNVRKIIDRMQSLNVAEAELGIDTFWTALASARVPATDWEARHHSIG